MVLCIKDGELEKSSLEELLKPPHDPVFIIEEIIKVAEQLANALARFHSLNVKHRGIKSSNVKFNISTGNDINSFHYAVYTKVKGQTSSGWLRKRDLKQVD